MFEINSKIFEIYKKQMELIKEMKDNNVNSYQIIECTLAVMDKITLETRFNINHYDNKGLLSCDEIESICKVSENLKTILFYSMPIEIKN